MREHSRSRQTTAQPERVWDIWSDTSTWASWNPDVVSMDPGLRLQPATETTMHTKGGREHRMKVIAVTPGRTFSLATSPVPLTTFTFTCTVEPVPGGSTIRQGVHMSGPLGWLVSATGGERVADGFRAVLDGLANAAERR